MGVKPRAYYYYCYYYYYLVYTFSPQVPSQHPSPHFLRLHCATCRATAERSTAERSTTAQVNNPRRRRRQSSVSVILPKTRTGTREKSIFVYVRISKEKLMRIRIDVTARRVRDASLRDTGAGKQGV